MGWAPGENVEEWNLRRPSRTRVPKCLATNAEFARGEWPDRQQLPGGGRRRTRANDQAALSSLIVLRVRGTFRNTKVKKDPRRFSGVAKADADDQFSYEKFNIC